ncbi:BON domain-containing protein [Microvirga makkahensis]|uniref:BON domain-containing protein n=1 Tax=Microvirga makkahensis TaxID=1128670 RepID=A0A7X3MX08_9HYPH|nr:BON domain-containing protein [Microvirga makkahensis]
MVSTTRSPRAGAEQVYDPPQVGYGHEDDGHGRTRTDPDTGPHRGRGPKGYRRSDARIVEHDCERLAESPHVGASDIDVAAVNGGVTLTGNIRSRIVKRYAEDLVESVSGVRHVQNNLRIQPRTSVLMGAGRAIGSGGGQTGGGNTPTIV